MRASSGGGSGSFQLFWRDLVPMLKTAMSTVYSSALQLISLFMTPFGELLDSDSGATSLITDMVSWFLDLFGLDFLSLTPLEFMLGSTIPLIILFTIYRYVKQ